MAREKPTRDGVVPHGSGARGARADSHKNELSRDGSVGRSIGRSARSVGRRRTGSAGGSSRTDEAMGEPRPPPHQGPGGGGGVPTHPPLKSLTDFIGIAPTDIGLSEMRTCAGFADGVRAKCPHMGGICRWRASQVPRGSPHHPRHHQCTEPPPPRAPRPGLAHHQRTQPSPKAPRPWLGHHHGTERPPPRAPRPCLAHLQRTQGIKATPTKAWPPPRASKPKALATTNGIEAKGLAHHQGHRSQRPWPPPKASKPKALATTNAPNRQPRHKAKAYLL